MDAIPVSALTSFSVADHEYHGPRNPNDRCDRCCSFLGNPLLSSSPYMVKKQRYRATRKLKLKSFRMLLSQKGVGISDVCCSFKQQLCKNVRKKSIEYFKEKSLLGRKGIIILKTSRKIIWKGIVMNHMKYVNVSCGWGTKMVVTNLPTATDLYFMKFLYVVLALQLPGNQRFS